MAAARQVTSGVRPVKTCRRAADQSSLNFTDRLPTEILIKILSYLDASALFSVSHVNKLLCQLANDNALWNKIYIAKFGKTKKSQEPQEHAAAGAGYGKWLLFRTMAARDMNKWNSHRRLVSQHTGLPSQTERFLRNSLLTWELTLPDQSGHEGTLEPSRSQFCETAAFLCWSGGGRLPNYQQIPTLQLHGVRRIALSCPGLKNPGWRSLMAEFDVQTLTKGAQVIGRDRLVELKLLQPGIIIGTWRDQRSVAFIAFTLHFHRLVERSTRGSSSRPYAEPMVKAPFDDIDPEYGLHGYQLHIVLHNTVRKLMSGSFAQLFCHRTQICDGRIQLTAIGRTNVSQHTPLSGSVSLPWRCEALQGAVENCCIMSLTLLDEFRKPFWCVSSPVSMEPEETPVSYDYGGEHFLIRHLDSDGQVKVTLVWMKEHKQFVVISLVVCPSVSKVNKHFGTDY